MASQVLTTKKIPRPNVGIENMIACFAFFGFSFLVNNRITNHETIMIQYAPINTSLHSVWDVNNSDAGISGAVPRINHSIESKMYSFVPFIFNFLIAITRTPTIVNVIAVISVLSVVTYHVLNFKS